VQGANVFDPPFWMEGGRAMTLLGTDFQGRDILSRLIHGARVSLIVGLMGTLVAGSIGTAMGIVSGYVGGWVDQIIMRVTDAWLALPAIVFAIFLAAMVGPSMWNIIVILGAVYWTRYARVIRGEVLTLREREFVKLAEIAGASKLRVIKKHILPNVMNTATVLASLTVGVNTRALRPWACSTYARTMCRGASASSNTSSSSPSRKSPLRVWSRWKSTLSRSWSARKSAR